MTANVQGKWEITYVGDFRDKVVFFYDTGKSAMGVWATIQFRIKNLQPGTDNLGNSFDFVAIDQDGKVYQEDSGASENARWEYCGCSTLFTDVDPGQENVVVITFDVPETTKTLVIAPTNGLLSNTPLPSPRFIITSFDQVPAFKPKK